VAYFCLLSVPDHQGLFGGSDIGSKARGRAEAGPTKVDASDHLNLLISITGVKILRAPSGEVVNDPPLARFVFQVRLTRNQSFHREEVIWIVLGRFQIALQRFAWTEISPIRAASRMA
jgi:hypothetical protein